MTALTRCGLVAAGYVAALIAAGVAVAVRMALFNGPDALSSSGMHAFGDGILFIGVFSTVGMAPTALALYFLRPYPRFWQAVAALATGVALTAVAAALLYALGRDAPAGTILGALSAFAVLRILLTPPFALVFVLAALLSPYRGSRTALLAASAAEAAVSAYGGWVWFVPLLFRSA